MNSTMSKTCRVCKSIETTNKFTLLAGIKAEMFKDVVGIMVDGSEGDSMICQHCFSDLDRCHDFKTKALQSEEDFFKVNRTLAASDRAKQETKQEDPDEFELVLPEEDTRLTNANESNQQQQQHVPNHVHIRPVQAAVQQGGQRLFIQQAKLVQPTRIMQPQAIQKIIARPLVNVQKTQAAKVTSQTSGAPVEPTAEPPDEALKKPSNEPRKRQIESDDLANTTQPPSKKVAAEEVKPPQTVEKTDEPTLKTSQVAAGIEKPEVSLVQHLETAEAVKIQIYSLLAVFTRTRLLQVQAAFIRGNAIEPEDEIIEPEEIVQEFDDSAFTIPRETAAKLKKIFKKPTLKGGRKKEFEDDVFKVERRVQAGDILPKPRLSKTKPGATIKCLFCPQKFTPKSATFKTHVVAHLICYQCPDPKCWSKDKKGMRGTDARWRVGKLEKILFGTKIKYL